MKTLKKILVLVLALALVFSFVACGEEATEDGSVQGQVTQEQTGAKRTPKPELAATVVDISAEQLNNYYVAYTVVKSDATQMEQDENGNYVPKTENLSFVEVGFSNLALKSNDGGTSFTIGNTQCFNSTADITQHPESIFSVHMNYKEDQLENKGTATVAGKECTIFYYKNGLMERTMYVDKSFGSTGMCLKYEETGLTTQTIEITELKFGVINTEPGYEFVNFQSKQATPVPADPAA